jgi:hypothetical protein
MKPMMPRGHKTGDAWSCVLMRASTRNCICNLELGEEDNLAEVAQANMLTEDTDNDPDNPPMDNQEAVTNTAL